MICTALYVVDVNDLLNKFPPKHECVYGDHSTIAFNPRDGISAIVIGNRYLLKIVGRVVNDIGDALIVENPKSENAFPHITVSCKKGVDPYYSNELIKEAKESNLIEYFDTPIFIDVVEGYFDGEKEYRG
jgi:hypothetical protein